MLYLNEREYVVELIERCALLDSKSCDTPMVFEKGLSLHDGVPFVDASEY